MASQIPAGWLVDRISAKSLVGIGSVLVFTLSALMFAVWPAAISIYLAEILHGFASCTLGPAIAAMSLTVAGQHAVGERLGRNARYASIGNGVAAALMGACGYYVSALAVFYLTAALTLPAVGALRPLRRLDALAERRPCNLGRNEPDERIPLKTLLTDQRLIIFALCAALFTLANAAMMPLASTTLTKRAGNEASLLIAACIVLPQIVVALASPKVGRMAETYGRRSMLLLGFATLPIRGVLFALTSHPESIVAIQVLDGIGAATFGVMLPLVTSDIAGKSGRFNMSLGFVGLMVGVGATISTTLAGWIADQKGDPAAFLSLGGIGLLATLLVLLAMPETRL